MSAYGDSTLRHMEVQNHTDIPAVQRKLDILKDQWIHDGGIWEGLDDEKQYHDNHRKYWLWLTHSRHPGHWSTSTVCWSVSEDEVKMRG